MTAISLVCPHCKNQVAFEAGEGWSDPVCPHCKGSVGFLCARVRSKRSRGDKRAQTRSYSIRLIYADREDVVDFNGPYAEFAISPGDWMAFGYDRQKRLTSVQNVTLARVLDLQQPGNPARRAAILAAVAVLAVIIGLAIVVTHR